MTQDASSPPQGSKSPLSKPPKKSSSGSSNSPISPRRYGSGSGPSPKRPLGPRSPPGSISDSNKSATLPPLSQNPDRARAGSSRTSVYNGRSPQAPSTSVLGMDIHDAPAEDAQLVDMDEPHAPYRPPEAVYEPADVHPPGYVPGVIEEHMDDDDDFIMPVSPLRNVNDLPKDFSDVNRWQSQMNGYQGGGMEIDDDGYGALDKPQVGPGVFPRRLLQMVHEHELLQPHITELPIPPVKKPAAAPVPVIKPDASSSALETPPVPSSPLPIAKPGQPSIPPSLPDYERICTISDVWDACPGGEENHKEWYFCTMCWGWIRIVMNSGPLPEVEDMDQWEAVVTSSVMAGTLFPGISTIEDIPTIRAKRYSEYGRYNDIRSSPKNTDKVEDHYHEFQTLTYPCRETRLERISNANPDMNAFPHYGLPLESHWEKFVAPSHPPRLFVSCTSGRYIQVDEGLIPGQIPRGLASSFSAQKQANPGPGIEGKQSVADAWNMLTILLGNALFKGQRGWVSLSNPRFQREVGMSEVVSLMLYHLGFACRQEDDVLRAGPYKKSEDITASDMQQMDRYMMRAWVEMQTALTSYIHLTGVKTSSLTHVTVKSLETALLAFGTTEYPRMLNGYPAVARDAAIALGITLQDVAATVEKAYDHQIGCDAQNTPRYLAALSHISDQQVVGKESLQIKVVMERSMNKYTTDDVTAAYSAIGYTPAYAEDISVPPEDAPDSHIYDLHKKASIAASNQAERASIHEALALLGKHRRSDEMRRMGEQGQTIMSVEEAYNSLSAPRNALDEGLIMQYDMAVSEYPGKKEHYKTCLSIIASAPGEERPGIQAYLDTGAMVAAPPPRQDIPVGLQNIGNTCYLNSILQYLYSIKPLRQAVIDFEQDLLEFVPRKAESERSRRFVRQLRLLFVQLYKSENPSVRPDEELAYLAITRPEVDAIVEPQTTIAPTFPTLASIPDVPSPSSTRVATPTPSRALTPDSPEIVVIDPNPELGSPKVQLIGDDLSAATILGKRQSQDRDSFSDTSPADRMKQKTEDPELLDTPQTDPISDGYEMIKADSPSNVTDLADLSLMPQLDELREAAEQSVNHRPVEAEEVQETMERTDEDVIMEYDAPDGPPPLPARPMARRDSTLASGLRFGLQQDSAEVLINVLSQLELAFDPSVVEGEEPGRNIISDLFSCKYRQQMFFEAEEGSFMGQAPVESVFVHPIIGVEEEGKDLYDCLGELYLRGSEIEYEGKKGYIMDLMDQFPPLLYIQMRRSQYDIATGRERKTNTHIPFGQTLQMDRFLATADPIKRETSIQLTRTMTDTRARLHQLRDRKPLSMPGAFRHVREALAQIKEVPDLDINQDYLSALESEEQRVTAEIEKCQAELVETKEKLDEVWKDERGMEYELVSVFMHRGKTSGAGHYWTYQAHLPDHPDKFFKYNDETVTEVPASEILQDRTGDDANPALLCYVRKGQDLVDTLHREILQRAAVEEPKEVKDEGTMTMTVDETGTEKSINLLM